MVWCRNRANGLSVVFRIGNLWSIGFGFLGFSAKKTDAGEQVKY